MIKFLFLLLISFSVFSQESKNSKEKYVLINLPSNTKENENKLKQEAALKFLLENKYPVSADALKLVQDKKLKDKAILDSLRTAENYISDVVYTSLEPGTKSIPITLSRGLPLSIILKDTKGDPVNYYAIIDSDTQYVACKPGRCANNDASVDPSSGMPNNIIVLRAKAVLGGGVLPVYTTQSDFPLSFNINIQETPDKNYIDRLVVVVNTGNEVVDENPSSLKSLDTLTRALNGIKPVQDAKSIYFNGPIKAWRKGDDMWVRTPYDMKIPRVRNTALKLSLNGVNVYKTRYSRIISVIDNNNGIVRYQQEMNHE